MDGLTMDMLAPLPILFTVILFAVPILIIFPPVPVSHHDALAQTHSLLGVPEAESRIPDSIIQKNGKDEPVVHSLWVYPVKSCQGIELTRARVVYTGLEHDRVYMFARTRPGSDEWGFITLRQYPRLATVKTHIYLPDPTKSSRALGPASSHDPLLLLTYPTPNPSVVARLGAILSARSLSAVPQTEILLPLTVPEDAPFPRARVTIWRDAFPALDFSSTLPASLGEYLGINDNNRSAPYTLGLFRMDPASRPKREIFRNAPRKEALGYQPVVDFQDGYPLNLMNVHSVQKLNELVPKDEKIQDVDVRRFRANIIISGCPPFEEECWKYLALRHSAPPNPRAPGEFFVACRSVRCKLPNVHPTTGMRHDAQPERTLRHWRGDVDAGAPRKGCMGMQLCARFPEEKVYEEGEELHGLGFDIEAGMKVEVVQRGEHEYIAYDHQKGEVED